MAETKAQRYVLSGPDIPPVIAGGTLRNLEEMLKAAVKASKGNLGAIYRIRAHVKGEPAWIVAMVKDGQHVLDDTDIA